MDEAVGYRRYADAPPHVRAFYREHNAKLTYAVSGELAARFASLDRARLGAWDAIEALDDLVDESDPDTELPQSAHAFQAAEAARADGAPDWLVLTALVHDLGKLLCVFGEPQWAVVGDTFPVGCAFDDRTVFAEHFADNPDARDPVLSTRLGVYEEGCGLARVRMAWGHDEYLWLVLREHLPEEALFVVRYHSFYALHDRGAYGHLLSDRDRELLPWLRRFRRYDLYSKHAPAPDPAGLRELYGNLTTRFLPDVLDW